MNYENLKVLSIENLFFKLPDDFNGGLSEALRLLADYHDQVKDSDKHTVEDKKYIDYDTAWYNFLKNLEDDKNMIGYLSISRFEGDESGGEMEIINSFDKI